MSKRKDFSPGEVFGDLSIVKKLPNKNLQSNYLCLCTCGNVREVIYTNLKNKQITHCGCKNFLSLTHGNRKFPPKDASFRAKAANYKAMSKKRNIEFKLSIDETITFLKDNCKYCNRPPSNYYNVRNNGKNLNKKNYAINNSDDFGIYYNGIDRIDNKIGYIIENCVTCCNVCNTAKLNLTLDEFKIWIYNVYNNLFKNK